MNAPASIQFDDALGDAWDAVVIGAGPAGSLTAYQLARHGLSTLLIEAKAFPRFKVCGGCLNRRALAAFDRFGLGDAIAAAGTAPLDELQIIVGRRNVTLQMPSGAVLSREILDKLLVAAAVQAGAHFLAETSAAVEPLLNGGLRNVTVRHVGGSGQLQTKVVICADGLGRSSTRHLPDLAPCVAPAARVGVGAVIDRGQMSTAAQARFQPGRIVMHAARGGYVGAACGEHGKIIIAAALASDFLKRHHSSESAVAAVLASTELASLTDKEIVWRGTPVLHSRAGRVADERLFVIGDAAGYVEPFTGEGIAWAAESALAVAPLAVRACETWTPAIAAEWETEHRHRLRSNQLACRALATVLHRPWAMSAAFNLARRCPGVAERLIRRLNLPQPDDARPVGRQMVELDAAKCS